MKFKLNMSEAWFEYAVLLSNYKVNILCFLLKLCKFEYGWDKL